MEKVSATTLNENAPGRRTALNALLGWLRGQSYEFVTPSPATHARFLARRQGAKARTPRDAFGWSMPFHGTLLPRELMRALSDAGIIEWDGDAWKSRVRVAAVGPRLYLHSAFPTVEEDAVFFGPDTYRFLRFTAHEIRTRKMQPLRVCDFGAGCGVGALEMAQHFPSARIAAIDCNENALSLARINAAEQGGRVTWISGDRMADCPFAPDLVIMNPPFMADTAARTYRDGGSLHGAETTLSWIAQAVMHLTHEGAVIAYSGAAIVDGVDELREELRRRYGSALHYEEIDVDIFGEEIGCGAYRQVERIAAVGIVIEKRSQ
jgi:methylase of polypeptide subunit release factors